MKLSSIKSWLSVLFDCKIIWLCVHNSGFVMFFDNDKGKILFLDWVFHSIIHDRKYIVNIIWSWSLSCGTILTIWQNHSYNPGIVVWTSISLLILIFKSLILMWVLKQYLFVNKSNFSRLWKVLCSVPTKLDMDLVDTFQKIK